MNSFLRIVSSHPGNTAAPTPDTEEDDDGRRELRGGGEGRKRTLRGTKGTFEDEGQGVRGGVSGGEWPMVVSLAGH